MKDLEIGVRTSLRPEELGARSVSALRRLREQWVSSPLATRYAAGPPALPLPSPLTSVPLFRRCP